MKKSFLLLVIACAILTACDKDKNKPVELSTKLVYHGEDPLDIALADDVILDIESDYPVTVKSFNEKYVTATGGLGINGKNVGNTEIEISNGYEKDTISVNVRLFLEPTFDFGCSKEDIIAEYGIPTHVSGDTILIYGDYRNDDMFVSYACTQMNFLFSDSLEYTESQVYIIESVNVLLERYLAENFIPTDTVEKAVDSIYYFYKSKTINNLKCGRYNDANQWHDTWLFYYESVSDEVAPMICGKPTDAVLAERKRQSN